MTTEFDKTWNDMTDLEKLMYEDRPILTIYRGAPIVYRPGYNTVITQYNIENTLNTDIDIHPTKLDKIKTFFRRLLT